MPGLNGRRNAQSRTPSDNSIGFSIACPNHMYLANPGPLTAELDWGGGGSTDVEVKLNAKRRFCWLHVCANRKQVYAKIVFLYM